MSSQKTSASVPVVDFAKFVHGCPSDQEKTASAVDESLRRVGFVYFKNHGVPKGRIEQCFRWSKAFFDLPYEEKMKAPHPEGGAHHRGYSGLGKEKVTQMVFDREKLDQLREAAPDVKESFESGNETDKDQPNIWPPDKILPGFREAMQSFFEDCDKLVHKILRLLALALDLEDPDFLSGKHSQSAFQLRLLHYPSIPTELLRSHARTRISAHSDFSTLTLLFQDNVGGLEIEDPDPANKGVFHPIEPRPGLVLVNIGDLMERWTNGRWKSTVHKVEAPPAVRQSVDTAQQRSAVNGTESAQEVTEARYSIPFFTGPNLDALVETLPGCFGPENPKKWEPITAGDYISMRMKALY